MARSLLTTTDPGPSFQQPAAARTGGGAARTDAAAHGCDPYVSTCQRADEKRRTAPTSSRSGAPTDANAQSPSHTGPSATAAPDGSAAPGRVASNVITVDGLGHPAVTRTCGSAPHAPAAASPAPTTPTLTSNFHRFICARPPPDRVGTPSPVALRRAGRPGT